MVQDAVAMRVGVSPLLPPGNTRLQGTLHYLANGRFNSFGGTAWLLREVTDVVVCWLMSFDND